MTKHTGKTTYPVKLSNNLGLKDPLAPNPSNDLSLPSSGVKISNDLNLYYEVDATKITILVEAKAMGWVGIGFSSTMTNCDMVIFNSNSGTVRSYLKNN